MALTKVSTDGVKDDAITSGKIPANAVGASELADNAVDTNAIADNAVTAGKTSGVQTTINGNVNNRVLTATGNANEIDAEGNFTFGSDILAISSTTQGLGARFTNTGNEYTELRFSANRTSPNNALGIINAKWNNNHTVASIYLQAGSDTTNKDDGQIQFFAAASGGSGQSRMKIQNDGNISITDGDLIVGSGHGINFQDTSDSSGTQESELLDDYEEGTFTPTINASSSSPSMSYTQQSGRYTKIGNLVYITVDIRWSGRSGGSGNAQLGGFPFTSRSSQPYSGGIVFEKNKLTSHADEAIISLEVGSNQSYGTFLSTVHDSSDSSSGLVIGNFQNTSGYLMVSLNYFTD